MDARRGAIGSPMAIAAAGVLIAAIALLGGAAPVASAALPAWPAASAYTQLPANANMTSGKESAVLQSVACTSTGNCVAVGSYADTHGSAPFTDQALVATETSGAWGPATEAKLPPDANGKPITALAPVRATLFSVSCASKGNCVAVGEYYTASKSYLPLVLTETNGVWAQGKTVILPANQTTVADEQGSSLMSVSCPSVGNCLAVGEYAVNVTSTTQVAMRVTERDGVWAKAVPLDLPSESATAGEGIDSSLDAVTCTSADDCVTLGAYTNTVDSNTEGTTGDMAATDTNGVWAKATTLTPPAGSVGYDVDFRSVSCTSPGNCVAVGNDSPTGQSFEADTITEKGGTWGQGQLLKLPAQTLADHDSGLGSVSCTAANDTCVAVGYFLNIGTATAHKSASNSYAMAASDTNGTWSQAKQLALPSNASTDFQAADFYSVDCTAPGSCAAVGSYQDKNNNAVPMTLGASATDTTVTKTIDNQLITMTATPPLTSCLRPTAKLRVTLSSKKLRNPRAAKLTFSGAKFYIDKGIRHSSVVTVKTPGGGKKKVTEITYTADASAKHLPASLSLSLKGLKHGSHTLKAVVSYIRIETIHGHKRTVTVATAVQTKFRIC